MHPSTDLPLNVQSPATIKPSGLPAHISSLLPGNTVSCAAAEEKGLQLRELLQTTAHGLKVSSHGQRYPQPTITIWSPLLKAVLRKVMDGIVVL